MDATGSLRDARKILKIRSELADQLLQQCPVEALADHRKIAEAVMRCDSTVSVLSMPEVDRWPETYVWLRDRLTDN